MQEVRLQAVSNERLTETVYEMTLYAERLEEISPGQFINVGVPGRKDLLLKRPFGIAKFDRSKRHLTFCYQVVGEGTEVLTRVRPGDAIIATYPLGNGFTLNEGHKKVMLVGGGIGVFPLLSVPQCHTAKYYAYLGYQSASAAVYTEEFRRVCETVRVATDDGSLGSRGFVTELVREDMKRVKPDLVLACGPKAMFTSLKKVMDDYPDVPCKVSVEERMGCGIGACLVCACAIKREGKVSHKRVCADGPVFDLREVVFDA